MPNDTDITTYASFGGTTVWVEKEGSRGARTAYVLRNADGDILATLAPGTKALADWFEANGHPAWSFGLPRPVVTLVDSNCAGCGEFIKAEAGQRVRCVACGPFPTN